MDVPVLGRDSQAHQTNWRRDHTGFMVAFHVARCGRTLHVYPGRAYFCFIALLEYSSINMGIGMGYHRLLTHRGYRTPKWLEYFLAVCGTLALEGGPTSGLPPIVFITSLATTKAIRIPPMMADGGPMRGGFSPAMPCTTRPR